MVAGTTGSLHKAGSTKMTKTSTCTAGIDTSKAKLDVESDGVADFVLDFRHARACGDASGKVRDIGGIILARLLNKHRVAHFTVP